MRSLPLKQTETNTHNNHTTMRREKKTRCFKSSLPMVECRHQSSLLQLLSSLPNIFIMRSTQQYFHANNMSCSNFQITGLQHLESTTIFLTPKQLRCTFTLTKDKNGVHYHIYQYVYTTQKQMLYWYVFFS
jgi:hypothetical protein